MPGTGTDVKPHTMMQTKIHFVHGNSFPSGTYNVFLDHLREHYAVEALSMHAHNPKYPVHNGWRALANELIDELTTRYSEPVVLVGHSMGGMLSLMVAKVRPDLVRCVVLLDAPVVAGWKAWLLGLFKFIHADKKFSPAKFSEKRRNLWRDSQDAYEHYAAKKIFAAWPPQVLRDYVDHGTAPHPQGVTLRFRRDVETAVYRSLPHDIGGMVRRAFKVPVGFVGGEDSIECRKAGLEATRRLVGAHFKKIPGGHLFPMESPERAAAATREMVQSLIQS